MKQLPKSKLAIIRQEGLALLYELQGDRSTAAKHREREIRLTERLHGSVEQSVERGEYNRQMAKSILMGRDSQSLEERRAIWAALKRREDVDGKPIKPRTSPVRTGNRVAVTGNRKRRGLVE